MIPWLMQRAAGAHMLQHGMCLRTWRCGASHSRCASCNGWSMMARAPMQAYVLSCCGSCPTATEMHLIGLYTQHSSRLLEPFVIHT
jgi:phage FluMu protein Com